MTDLLSLSPVVPVVALDDAAAAVPLAEALLRGGIGVLEITLRTPAALDGIRAVARDVPAVVVGAGTILTADDATRAAAAGASFLVSPGSPDRLLDAMAATGLDLLPGVSTVTEMMRLRDRGLTRLKFFPAEAAGGADYLAAVHGPLPDLRFCPTGGIDALNAPRYLALPGVACVGGSWVTPRDALRSGDWDRVETLARQASALRSDPRRVGSG